MEEDSVADGKRRSVRKNVNHSERRANLVDIDLSCW